MKNFSRIKIALFALLCLPFCGAWTAPTSEVSDPVYGDAQAVSTFANISIRYYTKTVTMDTSLAGGIAGYLDSELSTTSGYCGPLAATNALAVYDNDIPEMIPGWDARNADGSYKFASYTYVRPVVDELNSLMNGPGVTESGFRQGLTSYINGKGHSVTYTHIKHDGTFDFELYKQKIAAGYPIIMFVQPTEVTYIQSLDRGDILINTVISENHVMVAYGTYAITYDTPFGVRKFTFLKVATGMGNLGNSLFLVGNEYIDAMYTVEIA